MKKYWQIFWAFRRYWLMSVLEYRGSFVFWVIVDVMWTGFNVLFFALLVQVTGGISGWSSPELLLLLGFFTWYEAISWSFFYHNMRYYTKSIFDGDLNLLLIKPIDTQFYLMTNRNSYSSLISRIILGGIMFLVSISQLSIKLTPISTLVAVFTFITGLLLLYFIWFILATLAFYVEKIENINEILPSMDRLWRVPASTYRGIYGLIFAVALPLALITTLPSEVLIGEPNWQAILWLLLYLGVALLLSRLFFRISIKKYSGMAN